MLNRLWLQRKTENGREQEWPSESFLKIAILFFYNYRLHTAAPMSPMIARNLIKELRGTKPEKQAETLSEREKDILQGIASGSSERTIAERWNISYHTVHAHIKHIYKKLHVNSKTEALLKARNDGYL